MYPLYKIILVLALIISGCSSYYHFDKRKQIRMNEYVYPQEPIFIPSVMICSSTKLGYGGAVKELKLNEDSVLNYFMAALNQIELPIEYTNSLKYHCQATQTGDKGYFNSLTIEEVLSHVGKDSSKKWQLFPVIGVFISDVRAYYAVRMPIISLQIYLVEDGKVVYSSFRQLAGESINTLPANPPLSTITQEQWDELVRLVFEDYLNALDKNENNE